MRRADRFLFGPIDPWAAAVFRLALAAMLLLVFRQPVTQPLPGISHLPFMPALYADVFAHPAYRAAGLMLLALFSLGWRPRPVGMILTALLAPLVAAPGLSQSRQVLLFTLMAFSFVRSDARMSVRPIDAVGPLWPVRLIQLQLSLLYGVNALAKFTPEYLRGDVLVGQSATLPNFLVDLRSGALPLGPIDVPVWSMAVAVVTVEAALAVGFWVPRLRPGAAVAGVMFHVATSFIIQIAWLGWTSVFLYLVFLLPFERRGGRFERRERRAAIRRATGAPAGAERGVGAPRAKARGVRGGEAPRIELGRDASVAGVQHFSSKLLGRQRDLDTRRLVRRMLP
jgi:hypothetical protein